MRGATLFSGGGGVEALLKQKINFVHAVEYDPAIAAVYRQNHGDHVQVAKVEDIDYSLWGQLDYLHASPVCKNASQAKTGGVESDGDIQSALAVVRCLETTQPRVFTLENVWGYRNFKAFRLICQALDRGGYMWHFEHLNAADFGVPQTRRRLILRAVRNSLLPGWPAPDPWVGWYAAIEDLIPTLPESKFADWQLARLPEAMTNDFLMMSNVSGYERAEVGQGICDRMRRAHTVADEPTGGMPRAFIVHPHDMRSMPCCDGEEPLFTVTAAMSSSQPRAFLINGDNTSRDLTLRSNSENGFTIGSQRGLSHVAFLVDCQHTNPSRTEGEERGINVPDIDAPAQTMLASRGPASYKAWLQHGRVVRMTPRALARFQSLPDSYVLPDKASLACTIIGNMVPSLMMQKIVEPLL